MFKFIGSIFVVSSSYIYFNRKNYVIVNTIKFLKETQDIINKILLNYNTNLTYIRLFEKLEIGKTKYFKNFNFLNRNDFNYKIANDNTLTQEKQVVLNFINEIGKHNRQAEKDMLLSYNNNIEYKINELQNRYKNENKINTVMGFGVGVIIILTAI